MGGDGQAMCLVKGVKLRRLSGGKKGPGVRVMVVLEKRRSHI